MGKLFCDSTAFEPSPAQSVHWKDHHCNREAIDPTVSDLKAVAVEDTWNDVTGLVEHQRRYLQRLQTKGVLWKSGREETDGLPRAVVFQLQHGGEVSADGNCLFTACQRAMGAGVLCGMDAKELRRRAVARFLEDYQSACLDEKGVIDAVIRHMYAPDLGNGWGVHVVQDVKLLARKDDRSSLDSAIEDLVLIGMQREVAAESIYKERCIQVNEGPSWAKYMSISGSPDEEYDIVTLQYTEDGLLSVDENRLGHAAAFGDDIAIECLASEFRREIYVVQTHGADGMVDEENCVFFLPHRPRRQVCELPFFLFMKGTGWCGAGADHYEPLLAYPSSSLCHEKAAVVLGG